MQMKAAVLREQGKPRPYAISQPMTIETVDLDPPGPGEVLYKIIGAGLCHSDLSTIENLRPRKLPTIPGHEAAGIVEAVGPGCHRPETGRPRRQRFRDKLQRLPLLQRRAAESVPKLQRLPRRRHADFRRPPPVAERASRYTITAGCRCSRSMRWCRQRTDQNPRRRAAGGRGDLRLRRGHRCRRGAQHRAGASRRPDGGRRPGRCRHERPARRRGRGGGADRRGRPQRRTSCGWRGSLAPPTRSWPATPMWWRKSAKRPAAGWTM